ncbi:MAG: hypothetical protein HKN52_10255, partial [Eudoraea sp.]|nr:hypothetical protein [Eudoraea sp.]
YTYDSSENEKHNLNAKQLFLGGALLSVEGEGPTQAMALKDLLSAKLSNRTWGEAYLDDDILKAKELLSQGVVNYPPELLTLMAPLQDQTSSESLTFPSGYRIGMVKNLIGIDDQKTVFSFDYLPTANYRSIAKTTEAAFKATVTKTAQLAAREASVYAESAWSLLKEKEWMSHTPPTDDWLASIGVDYYHRDRVYWNENVLRGGGFYKITDIKGGTKAYWQIHKKTGEILGMLPDGSGGGSAPSDPTVDGAAAIIDVMMSIVGIISHLSSMFGFGFVSPLGGLALSVVAKYGVTLVKLYAIVSETIAIMDVSHLEESVRRELQILACNTAKEITFSLAGNTGAIMGGLDNLIGAMVPEDQYPFSCN